MKTLRPFIFPLLLILIWLLAACGRPSPNEATITMKEMAFVQSEITVTGEKTWLATSSSYW